MNCKLMMTVISEHQQGECGSDWKYDLTARVTGGAPDGQACISVPKHTLEPGEVRAPFGNPESRQICAGPCEARVRVTVDLQATEVDLFVDDVGHASCDVLIERPHPGCAISKEVDLAAEVFEAPAILKKRSVFTVRIRFTLKAV
jgi:hypothetical protein